MNEHLTLFEDTEQRGLSIKEASTKANVSPATIKNWIKTNYLTQLPDGLVSAESFENFMENVAGTEKLNSRANKSRKDSHNHSKLLDDFSLKLKSGKSNLDRIGSTYEESLSDSYRNKEGIYYTPVKIVKDLLYEFSNIDKSHLTFCDPCCGSGNFLIEAIETGFKPENVFGFDTDPVAVEISKERIKDKTGFEGNTILNTDFLQFTVEKTIRYNFIFTNPPWGKKLQKEEKKIFGKLYNTGNCVDTSALFFFASLHCLHDNGFIGFLLPASFFNISVFETARKKALHYSIMRLVDYGKAFEGLVTKAQAIVIKKDRRNTNAVICETGDKKYTRSQNTFRKNPKSILNFYCSNSDALIIDHIFSIKHTTLKDKAKWGLGIVTGNNRKYCIDTLQDGYIPVYKGSDITREGLKEPSAFIPGDMSLYQQVAPVELYEAEEKLIYKFISSKLCFYCDTGKNYILNSANMVIINKEFPVSSKHLADLLNSDIINWVFLKIFNTHKILRRDIETLPVHFEYFSQCPDFSEKTYLEYLQLEKVGNGRYKIKKESCIREKTRLK